MRGETAVVTATQRHEWVLPHERTIYVYLNRGEIEVITPATGICLDQEQVTILAGERPVARFQRDQVYFASPCLIAPPVLF